LAEKIVSDELENPNLSLEQRFAILGICLFIYSFLCLYSIDVIVFSFFLLMPFWLVCIQHMDYSFYSLVVVVEYDLSRHHHHIILDGDNAASLESALRESIEDVLKFFQINQYEVYTWTYI
jgi:hypothetical protein